MNSILIYGGSFDPIHNGHLYTARNIEKDFSFNRIIFLPCKKPVLKAPTQATAAQRVAMLKLAIENEYHFEIDTREIDRDTPSFMVDTLKSFREELGNEINITLLLGEDAFIALPSWHQWKALMTLCNLLVLHRAADQKVPMSKHLLDLLKEHETQNKADFMQQRHGKIYQFNAGNYLLSSSSIRAHLQQGKPEIIKIDLPLAVYRFIQQQGLYQ